MQRVEDLPVETAARRRRLEHGLGDGGDVGEPPLLDARGGEPEPAEAAEGVLAQRRERTGERRRPRHGRELGRVALCAGGDPGHRRCRSGVLSAARFAEPCRRERAWGRKNRLFGSFRAPRTAPGVRRSPPPARRHPASRSPSPRVRAQILAARLHDPPPVQDVHEIGNDVVEQPLVVGHHDHGALRASHGVHPAGDGLEGVDVEPRVGLVEDRQLRVEYGHLEESRCAFSLHPRNPSFTRTIHQGFGSMSSGLHAWLS